MKKKILALCLVVVLAVTAVTGATLAYFTDTDEKTNTFTMGDVKIHIDEWMENEEGEWEKYEDQELHPIAQDKAPANKIVETVNDGSEDAYIRTFITCPAADYWDLGYGFNGPKGAAGSDGTIAADKTDENGKTTHCLDKWTDLGKTTLSNGEEVYIFMCENYDAVKAGDSVISLTKVWVYDTVDNDDIGGQFKVYVYSEGIQSENLTYEEAMDSLEGDASTTLAHATGLINSMLAD